MLKMFLNVKELKKLRNGEKYKVIFI